MGNVSLSDATISRNISRQLASSGLRSPCHIQVQTRNGEVTLSGTVQFVHQRNTAIQAIRTVEGVKRVVEKLKVTPAPKHQYQQPAAASKKAPLGDEPQAALSDADAKQPISAAPVSANELAQGHAIVSASPLTISKEKSDVVSLPTNGASQASAVLPSLSAIGIHHTRSGDNYTFECSSSDEAERLRVLLASFADWLKKNSWVGNSKQTGDQHLVTFHAKSLIEFLRQQGF